MFSYEKFEQLCVRHGETPYQVSCATGVATSTLTSWKQGKYTPKIDKILLIASHFEVSIEELMEGDDAR